MLAMFGWFRRREKLGFALEPREALFVLRELFWEYFDRHLTIELRVACAVDLAHTAFADGGADLIRAETDSGSERHRENLALRGGSYKPPSVATCG